MEWSKGVSPALGSDVDVDEVAIARAVHDGVDGCEVEMEMLLQKADMRRSTRGLSASALIRRELGAAGRNKMGG
jgi:hypothetical protein